MLDYNYLEPLALVFEDWNAGLTTAGTLEGTAHTNPDYYTYKFSKKDNSRVKSFTIRRIILNEMAGGPTGMDEMEILTGCVCKSISFARSAGSSQVQVTMSGFYAKESMALGSISTTDYKAYSGNLVEYACLFIGSDYVANTESLAVSIDNSAEAIFNTCSPFAQQYAEGITDYTFSTTAYSNDPSHYKQRVYSGGQTVNPMPTSPMCKGMAPLAALSVKSMNKACGGTDSWTTNWNASTMNMQIDITNCVIRSLQWQSGDGSKLQDTISSAECQKIEFTFRSTKRYMTFDNNNTNKAATQSRGVETRSIPESVEEPSTDVTDGDAAETR